METAGFCRVGRQFAADGLAVADERLSYHSSGDEGVAAVPVDEEERAAFAVALQRLGLVIAAERLPALYDSWTVVGGWARLMRAQEKPDGSQRR